MKNKNLICILFIVSMIAGYYYIQPTNLHQHSIKSFKSYTEENNDNNEKNINPYNYKNLSSLPKEYTLHMAKENDDVVWTYKEVHNLQRLDNFINNLENGTKDMIRVVGFTHEGDAIIKDLEYAGEVINLTSDNTRDEFSASPSIETYEYKQIVVEKNFSELYKGEFTEYRLKNHKEDCGSLVLQIFKKK